MPDPFDLANRSADRFQLSDGRESCAFPVLERIIKGLGVVGELAQPLPSLSRIPRETELRIVCDPSRVPPRLHALRSSAYCAQVRLLAIRASKPPFHSVTGALRTRILQRHHPSARGNTAALDGPQHIAERAGGEGRRSTRCSARHMERHVTTGLLPTLIGLGLVAVLAGLIPKRKSRVRKPQTAPRTDGAFLNLSDPGDQLKAVEAAVLRPKKPVNREASTVLRQLEHLVKTRATHHYRVFAEVSLGAFVTTEEAGSQARKGWLAWMAINSKRVDFLIIDTCGHPAVAIEYHGTGHHREGNQAAARDAVKRWALEKAGIELVEIQASYDATQSQMMVEHALKRYESHAETKAAACVNAD